MRVMMLPIEINSFRTVHKGLERGLEELEIRGRIETIQTTEITQNTEKSPGGLRELATTQTILKDHQLTLLWKTPLE